MAPNHLPGRRAFRISFEFVQESVIARIHRIRSSTLDLWANEKLGTQFTVKE